MKTYKGETLINTLITYKIDGVKAIKSDKGWVSRAGKPLYNIPDLPYKEIEVFLGDWASSVSACRTINGTPISPEHCYKLCYPIDNRLLVYVADEVNEQLVNEEMKEALAAGYEGLVLHTTSGVYKVKDKQTYDVPVLGIELGNGKYFNMMGALITDMGRVGTGFTDVQRKEFKTGMVGKVIEVECMELTPSGMFRHPRFVRVREDKC